MPEGLVLLRDFAIIMVVAGATTLIFRLLRQPAILGYILAGVIVGPFTPGATVQGVETIRQLADLGAVLVMFWVGLEFSLARLRPVGLVALVVGSLQVLFMLVVGYGFAIVLGWPQLDAIFMGAAVAQSGTIVIVKVLTDLDRLRQEASRIVIGISVVQDFLAIAMIAILSGVATTGRGDLAGAGLVLLKFGLFFAGAIGLGSFIVPRLLDLAHRSGREAVLILGLGICFALTLVSHSLGLSVAAGAFLAGAVIAVTRQAEDMLGMVGPLRDVFAAIFFVAMGMLLDPRLILASLLPVLAFLAFNLLGKVFSLSLGSLISGYSLKTSVRVGMALVALSEFSLIIAKVGVDAGAVGALVFPVVVTITVLTTVSSPYLMRFSDPAADWLNRRLPRSVLEYLSQMGQLGRAFQNLLERTDSLARQTRHHLTYIFINVLITASLWGIAALAFNLAGDLVHLLPLEAYLLSILTFLVVMVLSLPSLVIIWRNLRALVRLSTKGLMERQSSARFLGPRVVARVLRDAALVFILLGIAIPLLPLAISLYREGSLVLFIPLAAAAFVVCYLFWDSVQQVHNRLQQAIHRTVLGQGEPSASGSPEGKNDRNIIGRTE